MLQTDLRPPEDVVSGRRRAACPNFFSVVEADSVERARLEARVRSGFGSHFGACVDGFMPRFALYQHASGATGVIGVRRASDEPLYLEHYLPGPVEQIILAAANIPVERGTIAEVGQFVVDDRDIVGPFFRDLVPFLVREGYDWVTFTGTQRIRALLERVGFRGLPVAIAEADQVQHLGDRWGSYYENDPVVVIGKLDDPRGRWCGEVGDPIHLVAGA